MLRCVGLCILLLSRGAHSRPSDTSSLSAECAVSLPQETATQIIAGIVQDIQSWQTQNQQDHHPFITITYAQSLDGKIAVQTLNDSATSSNLPLSGKESLVLTHALRSIHDAILVGGRTLSTDNPRLSNRLWGTKQSRPIVLDASLQHVRKLGRARRAQDLIVCCSYQAAAERKDDESLELLPCRCDEHGRLDLNHVLQQLRATYGIRSIMVEGGASVLSAFLSARLVDCLCVTVAPKLLGNDCGLAAVSTTGTTDVPYLDLSCGATSKFVPLGKDCIYLCQWPRG